MLGKSPLAKLLVMPQVLLLAGFCLAQTPSCSMLTLPVDEAVGVSITTDLEWEAVANATGYFLTVGTTPGGNELLDNVDLGDVNTYDFTNDLPTFQLIYVTITPYNGPGNVSNCSEVSFTTGGSTAPLCTEIINPSDGDELVSVTANITWIRDFGANGYRMTIYENDPNGIRILNNVDVGNGTNFKPPDFKPRTTYFVTIVPYNDFGEAVGCDPISFTTGDGQPLPLCTELLSPANGSVDVPVDIELQWAPITGAEGYLLTVGTTPRATDIVANEDVGDVTSYQWTDDLPIGQRIYVIVSPYDGQLVAENCPLTSFTVVGSSTDEIANIAPNFFTPNNDSLNDEWVVSSSENVAVQNVYIFDRYGKLIKQLAPDQPWDGTVGGRKLPSSTYWFTLEIRDAPCVRGYFLLKR